MFFKNWPYWLRGGFLGFVISFLYYLKELSGIGDWTAAAEYSLFFAILWGIISVPIALLLRWEHKYLTKKNFPYWLQGGIILSTLSFVIFFTSSFVASLFHRGAGAGSGGMVILLLPFYLIFIFAIGVLIGWIYGKLKIKSKLV